MERPIMPQATPYAYETFQVKAPIKTHWRRATCEEIDCEQWREGWAVRLEMLEPEDLHAMRNSGRAFKQYDVADGETWWVFEPGQPCFAAAAHITRLEREELFVLRDGDWRANPTGVRHELSPTSWVDSFGENQESLAEEARRG
jgi:hypothetical protein